MGEPFPGEKQPSAAKMTESVRRAVDGCSGVIRKATKEAKPECIAWLSGCDISDPHIAKARALRQTDRGWMRMFLEIGTAAQSGWCGGVLLSFFAWRNRVFHAINPRPQRP